MIMTGNTPRTLSFGGALGSLSLAILMLPFNASWGQKPDEPIEVEVVAKSVDEPVISVSEAVTIASPVSVVVESGVTESGSTLSSAASLTTSTISSDDAKPKVHLELKTGGSAYVIEADSMKEAISKLSEQVKVLSKKESPSRQDKLTAEALEQAIKSLEKSAKAIDEKSASADKAKAIKDLRKIVIRKLDKGGKIITEDVVGKTGDVNANADKSKFGTRYTVVRSLDAKTGEIIANDLVRETQNAKAVIDKQAAQNQAVVRKIQALISHQAEQQTRIQHQIEKLRAELEQKTKEVATAKKRLAELQQLGSTGNLVKPNTVTITGGEPVKPRIELQIRTDGGKLKAKGAAVSVKAQNAEQKEKRLEELERSLRKLLEDVASLKKQGN